MENHTYQYSPGAASDDLKDRVWGMAASEQSPHKHRFRESVSVF